MTGSQTRAAAQQAPKYTAATNEVTKQELGENQRQVKLIRTIEGVKTHTDRKEKELITRTQKTGTPE